MSPFPKKKIGRTVGAEAMVINAPAFAYSYCE